MLRRYPFNLVTNVIIMYLVFLQMFYTSRTFGSQSSFLQDTLGSSDYMGFLLIGLVFWNIALRSMSDIGVSMSRDMMTGTIEHILLSPTPSWFLFSGRGLSSLITTMVFLSLLCVPLVYVFDIVFHWHLLTIIVIFLLTCLGIQGFSYMLAGLQFLLRNIAGITQLLNFVLLFLCGIIFPNDLLPRWLAIVAECLPITLGLQSAREVMLGATSVDEYLGSTLFYELLIQSIGFYLIGILVYVLLVAVARKRGTLGKY